MKKIIGSAAWIPLTSLFGIIFFGSMLYCEPSIPREHKKQQPSVEIHVPKAGYINTVLGK